MKTISFNFLSVVFLFVLVLNFFFLFLIIFDAMTNQLLIGGSLMIAVALNMFALPFTLLGPFLLRIFVANYLFPEAYRKLEKIYWISILVFFALSRIIEFWT